MRIGIIAEEASDVEVLYELTCKLMNENMFSFKKFIGHGCGKLHRKCTAWAENLLLRGCSHLVVIHDLDNNDEAPDGHFKILHLWPLQNTPPPYGCPIEKTARG